MCRIQIESTIDEQINQIVCDNNCEAFSIDFHLNLTVCNLLAREENNE